MNIQLSKIREIFVGRINEIKFLQDHWESTLRTGENKVFVMLNAPGIGKTKLLEHFGALIKEKMHGLSIFFRCISIDDEYSLNKEILDKISKTIDENEEYILAYITENLKKNLKLKEKMLKAFSEIQQMLVSIFLHKKFFYQDLYGVLKDLSWIIPLNFVMDEVQQLQDAQIKTKFGNETALHYITRILADLLDKKIMFVLSGTRYTILSRIGMDIGSPIIGKVDPVIITKLSNEDLTEYNKEFKVFLRSTKNSDGILEFQDNFQDLDILIQFFLQFITKYSGGHGRTLQKISETFVINLNKFLNDPAFLTYANFEYYFMQLVSNVIEQSLLTSKQLTAIQELQSHSRFTIVKEWFLKGLLQSQSLGTPPNLGPSETMNEKRLINELIFKMLNIGIIIQNGNNDYYNTSYFHIRAFLETLQGQYEQFLFNIIRNKFFGLICGSDSGFGYTFENIIINAIMMKATGSTIEKKIEKKIENQDNNTCGTINLSKIIEVDSLKLKKIDWDVINKQIKPNVFYHTPNAKNIDLVVLQQKSLYLIQITSQSSNLNAKFNKFHSEIELFQEHQEQENQEKYNIPVFGWFISLFSFKNARNPQKIKITAHKELCQILGEEIYNKLCSIKESYRKL